MLILMVTGTPCSVPSGAPCALARSAARAPSSAGFREVDYHGIEAWVDGVHAVDMRLHHLLRADFSLADRGCGINRGPLPDWRCHCSLLGDSWYSTCCWQG